MTESKTITVHLMPDTAKLIDTLVAKGVFHSASEAVNHALYLLEAEKRHADADTAFLQQLIAPAIAELDAGDGVSAAAVFTRLEQRYRAMTVQDKAA